MRGEKRRAGGSGVEAVVVAKATMVGRRKDLTEM